jgi:hypothetical protein
VRDALPYQFFANAVLFLHFTVVVFVVGGLVLIIAGNFSHWRWINAFWFRAAHLAAISIVVAQAWLGLICPLTTLEAWLRARAGEPTYEGGFIQHWLQRLLYCDIPTWVFALCYSLFGLLVLATWWYFPPRPRRRRNDRAA